MAVKKFVAFDFLTAADVNDYLMEQSVMVLPGTAAIGTAGTAIGTATTATIAPLEGMLTYLTDVNQFQANIDGTSSGWYPVAGQMPAFKGVQTGTISTTNGNKTTLTFSSISQNRGGFTEASGIVTVPYTGWYSVVGQINWASAVAATRELIIATGVSGTYSEVAMNRYHMTGTGTLYTNVTGHVYVSAGNTIRLQGTQFAGTVNMDGSVLPCSLTINYLGA